MVHCDFVCTPSFFLPFYFFNSFSFVCLSLVLCISISSPPHSPPPLPPPYLQILLPSPIIHSRSRKNSLINILRKGPFFPLSSSPLSLSPSDVKCFSSFLSYYIYIVGIRCSISSIIFLDIFSMLSKLPVPRLQFYNGVVKLMVDLFMKH